MPIVHAIKKIVPSPFKSIKHNVTAGKRWFWGGTTLNNLRTLGKIDFKIIATEENQPAAILFTSGSTGPAKGVPYTHEIFNQQIKILKDQFKISPGEADLPTFPLFGLFNCGLGMTSIIPDMDCSRPAQVDPAKIIAPINDFKITNSIG